MSVDPFAELKMMTAFRPPEIDQLEDIWRKLPDSHPWTGWALISDNGDEVWIFRKKANWRRFILTKEPNGFRLESERGEAVRMFADLTMMAEAVASMPTLENAESNPG